MREDADADAAADDRARSTPALAAAVAAARASTTGAEAIVLERVGSRDVEIRLPSAFTPLERIAVSAEGDLQRIVASYYNAAVAVAIRRCEEVEPGLFDREVDLSVLGGQQVRKGVLVSDEVVMWWNGGMGSKFSSGSFLFLLPVPP